MGPLALQAGGFSAEYPETKKKESSGDWCETLQDFGTLYDVKKKNNPYVRRLRFLAVTNSSGLILTALIGDAILVAMAKNCVDSE